MKPFSDQFQTGSIFNTMGIPPQSSELPLCAVPPFSQEISLAQSRELLALGLIRGNRSLIDVLARVWTRHIRGQSNAKRIFFLRQCALLLAARLADLIDRRFGKALPLDLDRPLCIAIASKGALGDMMHSVPFLEEFFHRFAPLHATLFVNKSKQDARSALVSSGLPFIIEIRNIDELSFPKGRRPYDLLIELRHVVKYSVLNKRRVEALKPELMPFLEQAAERFRPYDFLFDFHPYLDGLCGQIMSERGMNAPQTNGYFGNLPIAFDYIPSFLPDVNAYESAKKLGLFDKPYIVLHDGFEADKIFDATIGNNQRITRSWPLGKWGELVQALKKAKPDHLIVQVGVSKTSHPIAGVDVSLLDRTTMHEVCWIIQRAALLIDTESGLMRIGWAVNTPVVSVQGPSGTPFFHFYNVHPILSPFCHGCYWVRENWNTQCLRGFESARCMEALAAESVAEKALGLLDAQSVKPPFAHTTKTEQDIAAYITEHRGIRVIQIGLDTDFLAGLEATTDMQLTVVADQPYQKRPDWMRSRPIKIRFGSPVNLPFADQSADMIVIDETEDRQILDEVARVLFPQGMIVLKRGKSTTHTVLQAA